MACGEFVKIRYVKQQVEHTFSLIWVWVVRAFLQIIYHGERVGQQPIHALGIDWSALIPTLKRLVRANKRFIEKMIEA
jgi:hypothetical protein